MNITEEGKSALHGATDAMANVRDHAKRKTTDLADRTQDMASDAWRCTQRAGDRVNGFVHRRPVETALLSAAAACLITGLAFWASRRD